MADMKDLSAALRRCLGEGRPLSINHALLPGAMKALDTLERELWALRRETATLEAQLAARPVRDRK